MTPCPHRQHAPDRVSAPGVSLSASDWDAFQVLWEWDGLTMPALARRLSVLPSVVAEQVLHLVEAGYAEADTDPASGDSEVWLSPLGQWLRSDLRAVRARLLDA